MRKLLMWAVVSFGIAALVRKLRRRGGGGVSDAEFTRGEPTADDPADELRRKLADTRDEGAEAAEPEATIDERRTEVHEEGRAAIDEMQQSTED